MAQLALLELLHGRSGDTHGACRLLPSGGPPHPDARARIRIEPDGASRPLLLRAPLVRHRWRRARRVRPLLELHLPARVL